MLSRNESPDVPFDRSVNPYQGCEHGCIYCFARPTHAWHGLSPGLDFETRILARPNAAELLERELRRPGYKPSWLALGANTDPYQQAERKLLITRQILQVLEAFGHPAGITTKSSLVLRDADVLARMAQRGLVRVFLSVGTMDSAMARQLEPRACAPHRRLETIRRLTRAGIPTGILTSPVIPALNDHELERILKHAADAGASRAGYTLLRLPLEVRDLFVEWLQRHAPDRTDHVLSLLRQSHRGRESRSVFGARMSGEGPYANLIRQRFMLATRRLGLGVAGRHAVTGDDELSTRHFRIPPQCANKAPPEQFSLFDVMP